MSASQGGEEVDRLEEARRRLREARDRAHRWVTIGRDRGVVDDEEVREFQALLKKNGKLRKRTEDPHVLRTAQTDYEEITAEMQSRLPDEVEVDEGSTEEANTRQVASPVEEGTSASPKDEHAESTVSSSSDPDGMEGVSVEPRLIRVDELTAEQQQELAHRYRLVQRAQHLEDGKTQKQLLEEMGYERTTRWLRNLRNRYEEEGLLALADGRWLNKPRRRVLTPRVQEWVKVLRRKHPAASVAFLHRKLREACEAHGIEAPCQESVRLFLQEMPRAQLAFLEDRAEDWDQQGRPVSRIEAADFGNERWQADITRLDVWVQARNRNGWEPSQVWATIALDEHSRTVAGYKLTVDPPTAGTVLRMLRQAIQPKDHPDWDNHGMPEVLRTDHGGSFTAETVESALSLLGIEHELNPPNYPQGNGKIERFMGTLDQGCLRGLDGHMEAIGRSRGAAEKNLEKLVPVEFIKRVIDDWIASVYHDRPHGTTDQKPRHRWEETARIRMPENDQLSLLMTRTKRTRTVQRTGIRLTVDGDQHHYWHPKLVDYWKAEVHLRYVPADLETVLVYHADTGDFLCEAHDLTPSDPEFSIEDVKEARRRYRRRQKQQAEAYRQRLDELDAEQAWDRAREGVADMERQREGDDAPPDEDDQELAATMDAPDRGTSPPEDDSEAEADLLTRMEQADRQAP